MSCRPDDCFIFIKLKCIQYTKQHFASRFEFKIIAQRTSNKNIKLKQIKYSTYFPDSFKATDMSPASLFYVWSKSI